MTETQRLPHLDAAIAAFLKVVEIGSTQRRRSDGQLHLVRRWWWQYSFLRFELARAR